MRSFSLFVTLCLVAMGCAGNSQSASQSQSTHFCEVDAKKICEGMRDRPITINGEKTDSQMAEQDSRATEAFSVPIQMESGDVATEVTCNINMAHRSVVYAQVTKKPQTDAASDYLRTQGLCAEQ